MWREAKGGRWINYTWPIQHSTKCSMVDSFLRIKGRGRLPTATLGGTECQSMHSTARLTLRGTSMTLETDDLSSETLHVLVSKWLIGKPSYNG